MADPAQPGFNAQRGTDPLDVAGSFALSEADMDLIFADAVAGNDPEMVQAGFELMIAWKKRDDAQRSAVVAKLFAKKKSLLPLA